MLLVVLICVVAGRMNGQSPQVTCCQSVTVSTSVTEDCCVLVSVRWNCIDPGSLRVIFEKLDASNTWTTAGSVDAIPASMKICPNTGSSTLVFRVKLLNKNTNSPWCGNRDEYVEGSTVHTRTISLPCCECPPDINQWLDVKAIKDNACPDNGCRVEYTLTIPESYSCFTRYRIGEGASLPLTTKVIKGTNGCIPAGGSGNVRFTMLMNAIGDGSAKSCAVEKTVRCDSVDGGQDTTSTPCVPDCPTVPFVLNAVDEFTSAACPGCKVTVAYTWRTATCTNSQDVQITRMEIKPPGCEQTCGTAQLYKDALIGIIKRNRMGFKPKGEGDDTCATTWRVVMGGCWSWVMQYNISLIAGSMDSVLVWKPCKQSMCCKQQMKVCKLSFPDRINISYVEGYTPAVDCRDSWLVDPRTRMVYPCFPKCNWLVNLQGEYDMSYAPMLRPRTTTPVQSNSTDMFTVGVGAEVRNDILALNIENDRLRSVRIVISDIMGTILYDRSSSMAVGSTFHNVELTPYPIGRYIYTVYVDGMNVRSGVFSLAR
jgi:hypothetical protein